MAQINVGEAAKHGIESGIEGVKETVHTAATTAENSVETVVEKIGETFNFTSSKVKESVDDLDTKKDEFINDASDAATEAVSEAETVLASEAENAKDMFSSSRDTVFENIYSIEDKMGNKATVVKETVIETLDDLEDDFEHDFDILGHSVSPVEKKVQEELRSTPVVSPIKEIKKEE
ncbi:hypothetical protein NQ314_003779 [Rhamnusium bicolor]|uniref:Uncharacterized protein n=1 Tax=Rhamnusium bicolor TaxID=1586634 RepID=A0AAV8ZNA9_9CUCU|nr:hypothetical protein NQ314_003779 [Rhamnusium bicolor]